MNLGVFESFRDRQITKKITKGVGKYRVLKARNIGDNQIKNVPNYDCYLDSVQKLSISKFINKKTW